MIRKLSSNVSPERDGSGDKYWVKVDALKKRCPTCGSKVLKSILYGLPTRSLRERELSGDVILGGCCIDFDAPMFVCDSCGAKWRSRYATAPARLTRSSRAEQAWLRKRLGRDPDMLKAWTAVLKEDTDTLWEMAEHGLLSAALEPVEDDFFKHLAIYAAARNRPLSLKVLLNAGCRPVDAGNLAHWATAAGAVEALVVLANCGAPLDECDGADGGGRTPLALAIELDQTETITALLDLGANPEVSVTYESTSPIVSAMESRNIEMAKAMSKNIRAGTSTVALRLAVMEAVFNQNTKSLRELLFALSVGIDRTRIAEMLLRGSVGWADHDMVKTLIECGATSCPEKYMGSGPFIHLAVLDKNYPALNAMLEAGWDINESVCILTHDQEHAGMQALDFAENDGDAEMVNFLLGHGAMKGQLEYVWNQGERLPEYDLGEGVA